MIPDWFRRRFTDTKLSELSVFGCPMILESSGMLFEGVISRATGEELVVLKSLVPVEVLYENPYLDQSD